jgi:asparagine synthase (glutamine-hydrolysing)
MCGIVGFWLDRASGDPLALLQRMNDALVHRGPDAGGFACWNEQGVGLGHRRLAIVDLSPAGAQPMTSRSGRYTIVFNGEVYNFERIRADLGGAGGPYSGHSDTEVMLRAFEAWGIPAAIQRFNGMFAFAVWDAEERRLTLARDRLGKKPLYYGKVGGSLVFGSELKALRRFPGWNPPVDRGALTAYLRHNYVPGPRSIYEGINKLPPGTWLTCARRDGVLELTEPSPYWSIEERSVAAGQVPFSGSFADATDELERLLRDAIALRCIADVPLGAFLSGGVDSSLIVALMQSQTSQPVRTFTIGFTEAEYNEAEYAKAVATHLRTDHTELYVSGRDALDVIPRLPDMYDEPFADSSQVPTALVCAMARRNVTVALSGDGGDEGFCGYQRYFLWRRIWRALSRLPAPLTRAGAILAGAVPEGVANALMRLVGPVLPRWIPRDAAGERLHRLARLARHPSPSALYRQLISHWTEPERIVVGGVEPPAPPLMMTDIADADAYTRHMSIVDAATYLPDDILVKVDRASMAVSLEARAPLLDHRVLEFAWSLPTQLQFQGERGKRLLWEILLRYVPRGLVDRPKVGFGIPLDSWLRGPLRDWAEALLEPARLAREGYFNPGPVRAYWEDHLSGRRQRHYYLWDLLMFQAWLERQSAA